MNRIKKIMIAMIVIISLVSIIVLIQNGNEVTKTTKENEKNNTKNLDSNQSRIEENRKKSENNKTPEYVVVIDPGHGGYDIGATSLNSEHFEKEISLDVSKQVGEKIQALDSNIKIVFTRQNDNVTWGLNNHEDLQTRVSISSENKADLFISLHMNAYKDNKISGFESWINSTDEESKCISNKIIKELDSLNYTENRGQRCTSEFPLQVIDTNSSPSVLVEMGFITSDKDLNFFTSEEGKEKIAEAIANAIIEHKNE